jgi:hypothetical protein
MTKGQEIAQLKRENKLLTEQLIKLNKELEAARNTIEKNANFERLFLEVSSYTVNKQKENEQKMKDYRGQYPCAEQFITDVGERPFNKGDKRNKKTFGKALKEAGA